MEKFPADGAMIENIFSAIAAVVIALQPTMTPAQRAVFAASLARLAANAEQQGNARLETLLIDLHRAANL